MTKGKEADGRFKLKDVVATLESFPGIRLEKGSKHTLVAKFSGVPVVGIPGRCALDRSTSYKRHIVPWMKKVTGYDKSTIDRAFRDKYWEVDS